MIWSRSLASYLPVCPYLRSLKMLDILYKRVTFQPKSVVRKHSESYVSAVFSWSRLTSTVIINERGYKSPYINKTKTVPSLQRSVIFMLILINQKHLDMKKTRKQKKQQVLQILKRDEKEIQHWQGWLLTTRRIWVIKLFSSHNVGAMETYAVAAAWVGASSKSKGSSSSDISDKPGQS